MSKEEHVSVSRDIWEVGGGLMDKPECPRVVMRMECPECGYPYSEALIPLDTRLPHFLTSCEDVIEETIYNYEAMIAAAPHAEKR